MAMNLIGFVLIRCVYGAPTLPLYITGASLDVSEACTHIRNCRTMWGLVYGCLLTVFACVWLAAHPNVPERRRASQETGSDRIGYAIVSLISPEIVTYDAWEEYLNASRMSEKCKLIEGWTLTHSYFVVMGGFFDPSKCKPVIPENEDDPLTLFKQYRGIIENSGPGDQWRVVMTKRQILDKSKSDLFTKSFATIQLVWFIAQYVGRWISHLHRSQLEATALAYAVLNVPVSMLWRHKPLDVRFPIHVTKGPHPSTSGANGNQSPPEVLNRRPSASISNGNQPPSAPISNNNQPSQTGDEGSPAFPRARGNEARVDGIFMVAGIIFGGIHCLAWFFSFPTRVEMMLWRISAVYVAAVPVLIVSSGLLDRYIASVSKWVFYIGACSYALARFTLLAIAFSSLRSPPSDLYRTLSWTSFIPHFG
ncbi:uncharacterized protein EI90DRAFT_3016479 [Cantharellus anzutake]|uniref:uncharacterized protein n=1 Tax=Cantharellus anzutake TaxID=1750568 RepID=UPI001902E5A5|nr:uncharacterized protein EI90DRAFT_3016479 [Cantharellus anzutake]KAF8331018.1 hypothetical protein EI90DRAFT_3016479 [Cantharellus anzutake]